MSTPDDPHPDRCELLGPFALFVQGALGALALLVLLWKRSREQPQRPLRVWIMDVCKQVFGAVFVHAANLGLSLLSSGGLGGVGGVPASTSASTSTSASAPASVDAATGAQDFAGAAAGAQAEAFAGAQADAFADDGSRYHSNPCSFYLLNLLIDCTIGVLILLYLLRFFTWALRRVLPEHARAGLVSGYYGTPPRWSWWARQTAVYFSGLMGMKLCVWAMFEVGGTALGRVGDWLLGWTEGRREVQVAFVMFLFPLVMNACQYYVIDSFIKFSGLAPVEERCEVEAESEVASPRESFAYDEEERNLLPKQTRGKDAPRGAWGDGESTLVER